MGGPLGMAQLMLASAFSQVYFHIHWLGDCMAGMLVGVLMGITLNKFALKMMVKTIFKAITGAGSVEESIYEEDL